MTIFVVASVLGFILGLPSFLVMLFDSEVVW